MAVGSRHKLVSFGTFEVDLNAGEIRKSGFRVRLAGQPFRLLAALLARPGEVLSREDLQQQIWGSNTNVDFERGLASAVNKLREALGDSADQPRYVETLARKGYRFIAPISTDSGPHSAELPTPAAPGTSLLDAAVPSSLVSPVVLPPALLAVADPPDLTVAGSASFHPIAPAPSNEGISGAVAHTFPVRTLALLLVVGAFLVLLTGILTYRWARQPSEPVPPPRIVQLTQSNNIYPGPPNPETFLSIASDGPRLYVPVLLNGSSQLSSLAPNGTEAQPISMPRDLSTGAITAISRDGAKLLIRSLQTRAPEQPLWIVPTTGSGALRVGEVLAHDATWMPGTEESVLFASGSQLSTIRPGSGDISPFATLPGRAFWLRWSPDGKALRFTRLDPVTHLSVLWELDAATRKAHPLHFPGLRKVDLCCGSWTPSGDLFVFQASDAHDSNLWAVGTGSRSQPTQLTNGPIRFTSPLPSRKGRSVLAFGVAEPVGTRLFDRDLQRFVPAPRFLENAQRISYSRDGNWVAWTDPMGQLWRARSKDGSDLLRFTGNDLNVFSARWSPDSRLLLLMARQPGKTWQIYTVSATGGALHKVFNDDRNLADPEWSADGREIVFGREADLMGDENGSHDIQLFDLATHQSKPLPGSTDLFSPRWSPDGQWITALSRDQARLVVYNVKSQSWTTLFTSGAADPVWSADSRSVYFHAFAQANSAILRVSVQGKLETIADLSKRGLPSADNYFFSGVTPDGSPLIEPRIGTGNLYSIELPTN